MYHDQLTSVERGLLLALKGAYNKVALINVDRLTIDNRSVGQWYLELSYNSPVSHVDDIAYNVDISAYDTQGNPLGIALFYNDDTPLSKIHVFRYSGTGDIEVSLETIKVS